MAARTDLTAPQRRRLTFALTMGATLLVMLGLATACELGGLLGVQGEPIECNITGRAVGFDGGEVSRVDISWHPEGEVGTSMNISGTTDGDMFTITNLVVPLEATRVVGEIGIGQQPTPPLPLKYGQRRVSIDLPTGDCNMDLGEVMLPEKGAPDDQTDENNNTNNNANNAGNNSDDLDASPDVEGDAPLETDAVEADAPEQDAG